MRIRSVSAEVRSLAKLGSATRGYAALDAPAFVLCRVEGENGLVGHGVTGRFLATQVAGLIAGGMAEALQGQDARRIEASALPSPHASTRAGPVPSSPPHCPPSAWRCGICGPGRWVSRSGGFSVERGRPCPATVGPCDLGG